MKAQTKRPMTLRVVLAQQGISPRSLAADLDVPYRTFYSWLDRPEAVSRLWRKAIDEVLAKSGTSVAEVWEHYPVPAKRRKGMNEQEREEPARRQKPRLVLVKEAPVEGAAQPQHTYDEGLMLSKESLTSKEMKHFGLRRDPFYDLHEPDQIWLGQQQQWVEYKIMEAARYHMLLAVVGEIGVGKSTIVRRVLARTRDDARYDIIIPSTVDRSRLTDGGLSTAICRKLAPEERVPSNIEDREEQAKTLLRSAVADGRHPLILIDEAHDLGTEAFAALKRFWDTSDLYKLLGVVLVGQGSSQPTGGKSGPMAVRDLGQRLLSEYRLREFTERCTILHLDPLTTEEVTEYMGWRFRAVEADAATVWDPKALEELARFRPVCRPLALNNAAVRAMRAAFLGGDSLVTREHVVQSIAKK